MGPKESPKRTRYNTKGIGPKALQGLVPTETGPAHFENGLARLKPSSVAGRDNGPRTDQSVGPVPWSVRYTIKLPMPYIRPRKGPKRRIAIETLEVS